MSSDARDDSIHKTVLVLGGVVLAVVLLRAAWVCDDAFITLRTVKQLVHGNGLVWNAGERVQAFTHPLWLMLLTPIYWVTREPYYTLIALSWIVSLFAVWWIVRRNAVTPAAAVLALAALVSSKAFVEYSSSGLENPLTHLLLAWFFGVFFRANQDPRERLSRLAWIAGLGALNRLDTALIFAPCLVEACRGVRARSVLAAISKGFAPFFAWELFSIVYYGFPFPNTAYAKLGAGIDTVDALRQGAFYLINALELDPMTWIIITLGFALAWRRRQRADVALCAGTLLYLVYVVWIGGDFMSGRFLTAPLVCMVISLARVSLPATSSALAFPAAIAAIGLCSPLAPLRFERPNSGLDPDSAVDERGICDERAFNARTSTLLSGAREKPAPFRFRRPNPNDARRVVTMLDIGLSGYDAPDTTHIVDVFALTDPLLARLPTIYRPNWRVGHLERSLPAGYLETLESGINAIRDPSLARYYDVIALVTRGPIFSSARWRAMWRLNWRLDDGCIDRDASRFPLNQDVALADLATTFAEGTPIDAPGVRALPGAMVLTIRFSTLEHARALIASVDYNDVYDLVFERNGVIVGRARIEIANVRGQDPGLRSARVTIPRRARDGGFDTIRVVPCVGDGRYAVGHLKLVQ